MTSPTNRDSLRHGQRLRDALVWIFGPVTGRRMIDPIFADYQQELTEPRQRRELLMRLVLSLRWGVALLMALLLDAITRPYSLGERQAQARVLKQAAIGCGLMMAFLTSLAGVPLPSGLRRIELLALLALGELSVAIPFGVLLGALSARRAFAPSRRPVMAVSLLCAVVVCGLVMQVTPRANQAFRALWVQSTAGPMAPAPIKGPSEMTYGELRRAELATSTPGGDNAANLGYRTARHRRLALPVACIVLGCLGMAFAGTMMSRTFIRRVLVGAGATVSYYVSMTVAPQLELTSHTVLTSPLWLPNLTFMLLAISVEVLRRRAECRAAL